MFQSKKLHLIIFSAISLLAATIIFIVAKVQAKVDILQSGYLICAILCVMTIFMRLTMINRMLGNGGLNPRDYKQTVQYKNVRSENLFSVLCAEIFIGLAFLLKLAI